MQQVGEKIKKYRTLRNLSQQQLANKCGLSKNAIWNYENNQRTPTIESLYKIADSLEIGINELTNNIKKQDDDNKVIKNVKHLWEFILNAPHGNYTPIETAQSTMTEQTAKVMLTMLISYVKETSKFTTLQDIEWSNAKELEVLNQIKTLIETELIKTAFKNNENNINNPKK